MYIIEEIESDFRNISTGTNWTSETCLSEHKKIIENSLMVFSL